MKDYQDLIGKALIAVAIVIFGVLVSNAITSSSSNLHGALGYLAELVRDGLIQAS